MPDGKRLAARLWLPVDAEENPVPALFEFLPYRKSDGTTWRDSVRQPYFAGHGYAVLRVDLRGSGDSDGVLYDEYTVQEHDDAVAAIAWIAEQPWCDGNVGMMGISWGGFNSLQVAARRPPELKAILVIGFTDDRYNDDVHYMGGCVITSQMLSWASVMLAYNALPPDPRWAGERWREMWFERMEGSPPFIETWLTHQTRDAYWKHGSVGEDYPAIQVPVYAVGGWADSYNNSVPRLLAGLTVPRKGLIGPWAHTFPELGGPEPAIGFLQESLRWWDHWLKGIDTGIMAEPFLRSYIQDSVPPATYYAERPGRWVADPSWPSPNVSEAVYFLTGNDAAAWLGELPEEEFIRSIRGREGSGFDVGQWGSYGTPGEWPGDQRAADGESLAFDSRPISEPVDILGYPEVDLSLSVDRPLALVAVRLCDVAPDGASTLVSWGLLNLTHRTDEHVQDRQSAHEFPRRLEPGRRFRVTVQLNVTGHRLSSGHRWRVTVSPTYVRHAWPSPETVNLNLFCGSESRLRLPVRKPHADDALLTAFLPAEGAQSLKMETLRSPSSEKSIRHDLISGVTEFRISDDGGKRRHAGSGMEVDDRALERYTTCDGDPLSTRASIERTLELGRDTWRIRIETDSMMTADRTHFHVSNHLDAFEDGVRVYTRSWDKSIPRNMV